MNQSHSTPMLAADPALPQRDLLLDESVMKEYLSRFVGDFGVENCERLRTKYRIGRSLRVLYQLGGNSRSYRIAARAFPQTHRVTNQFISPREIHAVELNTMFWLFPHDRKLKNLSVLNEIPDELREINGHTWINSRIVAHAPEKSVTAQCLDKNNKVLAYAKIYAGNEGEQFYRTYDELAGALRGGFRVPQALAYSNQHNLLLLEAVSGVSLSAVASAQRNHSFFRLGRALKELHETTLPSLLPQSTRFTAEALMRTARTISQVRPDVAVMVQQLTGRLLGKLERCAAREPVFLHGDVHPKNILLDGERLCLLDLDQAAIGVADIDLGSVIAGLYCDACIGLLTWREATSVMRAFLAGYGPVDSFDILRWHVAAALLHERALRAVTRIRTHILEKLPQLLRTAEVVLNGGIGENQIPQSHHA